MTMWHNTALEPLAQFEGLRMEFCLVVLGARAGQRTSPLV